MRNVSLFIKQERYCMGPELEKAVQELSLRMRLIRWMQDEKSTTKDVSEREVLLLQLISEKGRMRVTEIAAAYPNVSESTISTDLTRLWRDKGLIEKTINPKNQRQTLVELTDKGKKVLADVMKTRAAAFNALFHALQVSDDEREVLIRICTRAVKYMDEHLGLGAGKNKVKAAK